MYYINEKDCTKVSSHHFRSVIKAISPRCVQTKAECAFLKTGNFTKHYALAKYIILLLLLLSGCSGSTPGIDITEQKYETETSAVEIQIPNFKNFQDEEFQESLNREYNESAEKWLSDFSSACEKNVSGAEKCTFRLKQELKLKQGTILSIVGDAFIFTEGVHGSSWRLSKNIDTAQSKVLELSDLFSDESYPTAINREINKILEKNPEEYHDLWEKPILSSIHQEFFYLTNDGLIIFFPPYELSYYARGFVEFCIPYSELSGYMKPEYQFLAN